MNKLQNIKVITKNLVLVLIIITFSGCGWFTQRKVIETENIALKEMRNKLEQVPEMPESSMIKFSGQFVDNKTDIAFNGTMRIKKDSIIWLSLSPGLGIELFRIKITPDSLIYLNRLKKEAGVYAYQKLIKENGIMLEFKDIQQLFYGYLTYIPDGHNKFFTHVKNLENNYLLHTDSNNTKLSFAQYLYLTSETFRPEQLLVTDVKTNRRMTMLLKDYQLEDSIYIPGTVLLQARNKDEVYKFDYHVKKIYINRPQHYSFEIPDNYKIVTD